MMPPCHAGENPVSKPSFVFDFFPVAPPEGGFGAKVRAVE